MVICFDTPAKAELFLGLHKWAVYFFMEHMVIFNPYNYSRMSLAAASLSEGAAEPSSTGSEDSLVIPPSQVCARSYDSIDSLCPNVRPFINNSRQSLDSMGSYESLPR